VDGCASAAGDPTRVVTGERIVRQELRTRDNFRFRTLHDFFISPQFIAASGSRACLDCRSAMADPMSDLAAFSSFKTVNVEKLAAVPCRSRADRP
jgi:hypothetical protein